MHWIADLWWFWLLGCIATIAFAIRNQMKRMNTFSDKGLYTFTAGIICVIFEILLVTAIVVHLINYAKN